ncbi:MAG: hypothetical protein KAS15_03630 [Nanoarchaeota archaeon]|nr:hypothetical protein [Nanoarchaeota archaeon]
MADEELAFTGVNYMVCKYCNSLMRGRHRDGSNDGCKLIQNKDGKYSRINTLGNHLSGRLKESGIDFVDGSIGCEDFNPSGIPAHPKALEVLVKNNPKCSAIPSDPNAIETSWDFYGKMDKFLPKENFISYTQIQ